ncbi:unnamed protein product [Rotaria socialis]
MIVSFSAKVHHTRSETGIEVAKLIGVHSAANLTNQRINNYASLRFQFNTASHINGWWCVRMYESTASWQDNYLCTNYDIGLSWRWKSADRCSSDLKCVATVEPGDPQKDWWQDNALCLPVNSNIELIWSWCGPLARVSCVQLYDSSSPAAFHDNHLCWKVKQ